MRPSNWLIECENYETIKIDGYKMIISKETADVITNAAEMVRECLACWKRKEWCNKSTEYITYLDTPNF